MSLQDIFNQVTALDVTIDSNTVPARNIGDRRNKVNNSDLPVRLMMWSSDQQGAGNDLHYVDNVGNTISITWHVVDLMLFAPEKTGLGFYVRDPKLVEYADNYRTALHDFTTCAEPFGWQLVTATIQPGNFEYPLGSDLWYVGVQVSMDILELD